MSEDVESEQSAADVAWLHETAGKIDGAAFVWRRPAVPDGFVTDPYTGEQWMTHKDGDTITYEFDVPGVVTIKATNVRHVVTLVEAACIHFLEVKHD